MNLSVSVEILNGATQTQLYTSSGLNMCKWRNISAEFCFFFFLMGDVGVLLLIDEHEVIVLKLMIKNI